MPFISKDWRSPGEEWVKTEEGWEKKKILECSNGAVITMYRDSRLNKSNDSPWIEKYGKEEEDEDYSGENDKCEDLRNLPGEIVLQPHCRITIKCTKEIAGFNGLSDAFKRLDFRSAVHDIRRFNYICKLLDLLIKYKLPALSGCARKGLFNMLEEVARYVSANQQNMHLLMKLLNQLRGMVDCACWGHPLGSTALWENHLNAIDRIHTIANSIQIQRPSEDSFPKLENLPEECIREVLLRLADHKDLEAGGQAYTVMARLCEERRIWKKLCRFHFTPQQIQFVLNDAAGEGEEEGGGAAVVDEGRVDWQKMYHKLRKSFGLREEYAEVIQLCRNCRCLFWQSIGHPCIAETNPDFMQKLRNVDKNTLHVPIPPQAFLTFFSL